MCYGPWTILFLWFLSLRAQGFILIWLWREVIVWLVLSFWMGLYSWAECFFFIDFCNVQTCKQNTCALWNEIPVVPFVVCYCSSYLHCKWATLEELEKDPRIHQKIKRFRTKQAQMKHLFTEVTVNIIFFLLSLSTARVWMEGLSPHCESGWTNLCLVI